MIISDSITYRGHTVTYEELKPNSKIKIDVRCDSCGKTFASSKYQIVRNGHQLCQQCALRIKQRKDLPIGSKFGRLEVVQPSSRVGYSVCRCECGRVREFENVRLRRGTTRSCGCLKSDTGKRIAGEYLSNYWHGESHPNWKGGISPERNRIEKTREYREFRDAVFERDGHKCRKCGTTENLCVHHVLDYMAHPELRCDADNGITLCRSCHTEFHGIYGKGSKGVVGTFGAKEIEEFIA